MAIALWVEIVCNQCSTHGPGQWTYGTTPRKALVDLGKQRGWQFHANEAYCSQACYDAYLKDTNGS